MHAPLHHSLYATHQLKTPRTIHYTIYLRHLPYTPYTTFYIPQAVSTYNHTPCAYRGDYAIEVSRNVCHGSDSVQSAEREVCGYTSYKYI
ncbi:hypothetical protein EON63_09060 [archaeon]|nr:MAG: hypothetical protein EON63_09060 [archaeon]